MTHKEWCCSNEHPLNVCNCSEAMLFDEVVELRAELEAMRKERDALQRHYDAASPEHNLLALLDLYEERRSETERERDEMTTRAKEAEALLHESFELGVSANMSGPKYFVWNRGSSERVKEWLLKDRARAAAKEE